MRIRIKNAQGERIEDIEANSVTVGRGGQCEIRIVAEGISRQHLKIEQRGSKYYVQDLGSTNGSQMAEKKLPPNEWVEFTALFPVEIGKDTQLVLEIVAPEMTVEVGPQERVRKKLEEKLGRKRNKKKKSKSDDDPTQS